MKEKNKLIHIKVIIIIIIIKKKEFKLEVELDKHLLYINLFSKNGFKKKNYV